MNARHSPGPRPRRAGPLGLAAGALLALAAPATAEEPCGEHVVAAGETLSGIAQARLGAPDVAAMVAANPEALSDPDRIRVGQSLRLPCPPGAAGPAPAADPPAGSAAPDRNTAAAAEPPDEPAEPAEPSALPSAPGEVRALHGGDAAALAPAAALPALVAEALSTETAAPAPRPAAAPTEALAETGPDGPWHISYPWIAPDCGRLERLPPELARRCARLAFSAPLARQDIVWIVRPGSAAAAAETPQALRGLTLCRPEGAFDGDLAALGLAPPRAERLSPQDAAGCLAAVASGEADTATLRADEAANALADRPPGAPPLAENAALASEVALSAAARRDSPAGLAALAMLDAGLAILRTAREAEPARDPLTEP